MRIHRKYCRWCISYLAILHISYELCECIVRHDNEHGTKSRIRHIYYNTNYYISCIKFYCYDLKIVSYRVLNAKAIIEQQGCNREANCFIIESISCF